MGQIVLILTQARKRVGVLLVDPSSPITGGAVLADRIRLRLRLRLRRSIEGDSVYVRSVASRGAAGGLSAVTGMLIALLDAWGADIVLIETVGAGQGEIDVCRIADRTVLVCPPGLGDDLQAMKAGLMELADVFVVNKADRPGAEDTAASLHRSGSGGSARRLRPVLRTVATTGQGVSQVVAELDRQLRQARGAVPALDGPHLSRRAIAAEAARLTYRLVLESTDDRLDLLVEDSARDAAALAATGLQAARLVLEALP